MALTAQLGTANSQPGNIPPGYVSPVVAYPTPAPSLSWTAQATASGAGLGAPAAPALTWAASPTVGTEIISIASPAATAVTWAAPDPLASVGVKAPGNAASLSWTAQATASGAAQVTAPAATLAWATAAVTAVGLSSAPATAAAWTWVPCAPLAEGLAAATPSPPALSWAVPAVTPSGQAQARPGSGAWLWSTQGTAVIVNPAAAGAAGLAWAAGATLTLRTHSPVPLLVGPMLSAGFWRGKPVMYTFTPGSTSQSIQLFVRDSAQGLPLTGLTATSAGAAFTYTRQGSAQTTFALVALAGPTAAWTSGGFVELGHGLYRLDLPDAALAGGVPHATVTFGFTASLGDSVLLVLAGSVSLLGPGATPYTVTVTNTATGSPLPGAGVWVSTDAGGTNVIAGTLTTDAAGTVTFLLDTGHTYYLWCQDPGYNGTNPTLISV